MNEEDVRRTWDLLHQERLPAFAGHPYMLHWFASKPGGKDRMGDYALSADEFVKAARAAETRGMNFYVQMNPSMRRDGVRNRTEDVTHWAYFLLDVDPGDGADPFLALEEFLRFYHHRLGVKLHPHVVFSGRGVQAWQPFTTPIATSTKVRLSEDKEYTVGELAPRVQKYWLYMASDRIGCIHGCILDVAVNDLPRVMRVPGTVNVKSGMTAELLRIGKPVPQLDSMLIRYADERAITPPPPPEMVLGRTWQFYVPRMNWSAHAYVTKGSESGSRHDTAVKTAKNLFELGCEEEQAAAALAWGNKLSMPEPLPQEEMDQILRSVYRRGRIVV